ERLRAEGLHPRPPRFLPRTGSGRPIVEVRRLGHRYPNGFEALADVNLRIVRGEFVALVGRNGSGKTTLAQHLNGLLAPTAGQVFVDGAPIAGQPLEDLARRVGYVFQDPDHQLFAASVEEEVAFGPETWDSRRRRSRRGWKRRWPPSASPSARPTRSCSTRAFASASRWPRYWR